MDTTIRKTDFNLFTSNVAGDKIVLFNTEDIFSNNDKISEIKIEIKLEEQFDTSENAVLHFELYTFLIRRIYYFPFKFKIQEAPNDQ